MKSMEFNGEKVTIMTCSDCNTRCKHCYISYNGNFEVNRLYNLCETLIKKFKVHLNGTEILLHPEYFETLKLIRQDFFLTNGLELERNPSIIQKIASISSIKYAGISYHFGIHENISKIKQKTVRDSIDNLAKYGISTDLRVTITSKNYELLPEMCEQTILLGASGIKFTNYMNMGAALSLEKDNILKDDEVNSFFTNLIQLRKKYSKDELLIRRCGSFGKDFLNKKCNFHCTAGTESVVITPNMKVYPCIFLAKEGMEIGHVEEDNRIIIDYPIEHDGLKCLAKEINNNGYNLKK